MWCISPYSSGVQFVSWSQGVADEYNRLKELKRVSESL